MRAIRTRTSRRGLPWRHTRKAWRQIFAETGSTKEGLDEQAVENRQAEHGFNELATKERDSVLKLFVETFKDAMVIVLLAVAAIQMVMGHAAESLIIFAVLMINAIVSVIQTRKAEGSLDALKSLSAPMAKVKRAGAKADHSGKGIGCRRYRQLGRRRLCPCGWPLG